MKNSSGVGTSLLSCRCENSKKTVIKKKQIDLAKKKTAVSRFKVQNLGQKLHTKIAPSQQHFDFLNFGQMSVTVHSLHPNWTCAHRARCRNKLAGLSIHKSGMVKSKFIQKIWGFSTYFQQFLETTFPTRKSHKSYIVITTILVVKIGI